ncbi:MAG: hypothetical protein HYV96_10815 [Opitutae bacterium]|nr:hypothetical protein [Opitutae bacterium]
MKLFSQPPVWRALLFAGALLAPMLATAKPSPTDEADAVIDRWIDAAGGAKRLKAAKQSDFRMRLTVGPGTVLEMQGTSLANGAYRLVTQTPSGEVVNADDGRLAWMHHASLGGRIEDPAKAERMRRENLTAQPLHVRDDFPTRRRLPDAEIDGRKLQALELIDRRGWKERWYFNPSTGLRVRRECPDDDKPKTVEASDFRKVNGLVMPFRVRALVQGAPDSVIEVVSIVHQSKITAEPWHVPEGLEADSKRVDEAMQRFETVIGSKEAIEKIKTRVTKSRLEITSNGMAFDMTMSQKKPNRVLIEQDIPGVGRMMQGYDGKTGWAWGEMQGYREVRGAELGQLIGSANIVPRKIGDEAPLRRVIGESTGKNGHRVLAVDLATFTGSVGIFHFDLETGLLVKIETLIQAGPGGSMKVVMDMDDYREVDGVKMAFAQTVTNPAVRVKTQVLEVVHNRELPDEMFLPRKNGEIPGKPAAAATIGEPAKDGTEAAPSVSAVPAK